MNRWPLVSTVVAVLLLAASLAYWALQLYQPPQRPIAAPPPPVMLEPQVDAAAALFGGQPVVEVANYTLTGVVSAGRDSVAILVADGKPPKAIKLGREIAPGVTVQEVHPRYVMISEGGVAKRVDLPQEAKPAAALTAPIAGAQPPGQNAPEPAPQTSATPAPPPQPMNVPPPPPSLQMPAPTRTTGGQGVAEPPTQQ